MPGRLDRSAAGEPGESRTPRPTPTTSGGAVLPKRGTHQIEVSTRPRLTGRGMSRCRHLTRRRTRPRGSAPSRLAARNPAIPGTGVSRFLPTSRRRRTAVQATSAIADPATGLVWPTFSESFGRDCSQRGVRRQSKNAERRRGCPTDRANGSPRLDLQTRASDDNLPCKANYIPRSRGNVKVFFRPPPAASTAWWAGAGRATGARGARWGRISRACWRRANW